ncbi:glycosyltransferase family 4 protein [Acinetobacter sp. YH12054]|uniref:glycosyltransferase family 4 protein n=1 Tax=Acinetobacter sp. YH12054 TaxID=2601056 RepID=UPI0015D2DEEE|nr:glycosyltransferase family 4 protein [Acinetobacter sp. YH12054]
MNLIIWMNQPSHHQSQFFDCLDNQFHGFKVFYYGTVSENRKEMGWDSDILLKSYEQYFDAENQNIDLDFMKNYIHIIPGYGNPLLLKLRKLFSKNNVKWIHWSEKASQGWKWYASYPKKKLHAYYINKHALGALAIGEHAKQDFIKWGVDEEKIDLLPYSFNTIKVNNPDKEIVEFKKDRKAFLFVGSLYPTKGIDLLLTAFAKKFKNHPDWCLVLVGNQRSGYNYKDLSIKLGIDKQVLFRGVIPAIDIHSAYSACDVFVLPSRYDGWGMVVNEALYCSLPVIASNAVGASLHLITSDNGYIFSSGDSNELAEYMGKYQDKKLLNLHSKNSKKQFELFNSDVFSKKLFDIIKRWDNQ